MPGRSRPPDRPPANLRSPPPSRPGRDARRGAWSSVMPPIATSGRAVRRASPRRAARRRAHGRIWLGPLRRSSRTPARSPGSPPVVAAPPAPARRVRRDADQSRRRRRSPGALVGRQVVLAEVDAVRAGRRATSARSLTMKMAPAARHARGHAGRRARAMAPIGRSLARSWISRTPRVEPGVEQTASGSSAARRQPASTIEDGVEAREADQGTHVTSPRGSGRLGELAARWFLARACSAP